MPLGIHALNEGVVVLALGADTRRASAASTNSRPHQQARAGTDSRAFATTANRGAGYSTHCRTDRSTGRQRFVGRLAGSLAANLLQRKITAVGVILTETLDALPGSRQDHDIRTGRHDGAGAKSQRAEEDGDAPGGEIRFQHVTSPVARAELFASRPGIP